MFFIQSCLWHLILAKRLFTFREKGNYSTLYPLSLRRSLITYILSITASPSECIPPSRKPTHKGFISIWFFYRFNPHTCQGLLCLMCRFHSEIHMDSAQTALHALLSSSFLIWLMLMASSLALTQRSDCISHRFTYQCSLQKTWQRRQASHLCCHDILFAPVLYRQRLDVT